VVGRDVEIEQRLAVFRDEGIEIDQSCDLLRHRVGDRSDHHAAIGMAEQHHIRKVFIADDVEDVGDMGAQVDGSALKMRALALPGQRRCEHDVAALAQSVCNPREFPAATPGAVNQNVSGHE